MDRIVKEDITVGTGIIATYQRMPQKLERVFAEFIDNSTQSYFDHKDDLVKINGNDICRVQITWNEDRIEIVDNCFGMNHDDFKRALKLNSPASHYSKKSRSEYGMGLKTAAVYLGNWYSIESTQFGIEEKYYSTIDVKDWIKDNPTQIDNNISIVKKEEHFTKIVIKNLEKKLTNATDRSIRKKLSNIYKKDIQSGILELYLNGKQIEAIDPELRVNSETGAEYIKYFDEKFNFDGKEYKYSGWVGILKTASTDDAGFSIMQYNRTIEMNYRPTELFKKSNSFEYQRVVGEIDFDGKEWKISFNKDKLIWDDGLEKAFIESIQANKEVMDIFRVSRELRKDNNPIIDIITVRKQTKTIENRFSNLAAVTKTQIITEIEPETPTVILENDTQEAENIVSIEWESINYRFDVRVNIKSPEDDWLQIEKKADANEYYLIINGSSEYFSPYNKKECKELIESFAISLALARLSSQRLGLQLKDSDILFKQLNNIIRNAK